MRFNTRELLVVLFMAAHSSFWIRCHAENNNSDWGDVRAILLRSVTIGVMATVAFRYTRRVHYGASPSLGIISKSQALSFVIVASVVTMLGLIGLKQDSLITVSPSTVTELLSFLFTGFLTLVLLNMVLGRT